MNRRLKIIDDCSFCLDVIKTVEIANAKICAECCDEESLLKIETANSIVNKMLDRLAKNIYDLYL